MRRTAVVAGMILLCVGAAAAQYQPTWRIQHYELEYEILPSDHIYRGTATLSLENISDRGQTTLPLGLYRLQDVEGVEDTLGRPLEFVADVVKAPDWPGFQAVTRCGGGRRDGEATGAARWADAWLPRVDALYQG